MTRGVTILGSTGSIGQSTLDVLSRHPERFRVVALAAHRNVDLMLAQCRQYQPRRVAMADPEAARALRTGLGALAPSIEVLEGATALDELAAHSESDTVVAAIVGAAGLPSLLAAATASKRILLANKEALVMAGPLFLAAAKAGGAQVLPLDSEHNAVFQCLPGGQSQAGLIALGVERIILTASGGPFRETPAADLAQVTPEQACAHPNWVMGRKISVDSATLMNKGLEVIEACWLFDLPPERVEVVVHPQSLVHSLVQYRDGSVLAELGYPDMRTPIAHALAWPDRITSGVPPLDLLAAIRCDFQAPDRRRFPCLDLAYGAIRAGGTAPLILNAANEIAVAAFLDHRLGFTQIFQVVDRLLQDTPIEPIESLEQLLAADRRVRQVAHGVVRALA